jgi:hypothetical protein
LRHSSATKRWLRAEAQHITHRSWLKLLDGHKKWVSYHVHRQRRSSAPENDKDPSTFLSERVPDRDADIIKRDPSSASRTRIRRLYLLGLDTRTALNEYHGEAVLSVLVV